MSMTLNPVNEAAFQKAVQSLETLNRAAVFHPTGTGKSCIAWKVVEAHPQTTFFWLVAVVASGPAAGRADTLQRRHPARQCPLL